MPSRSPSSAHDTTGKARQVQNIRPTPPAATRRGLLVTPQPNDYFYDSMSIVAGVTLPDTAAVLSRLLGPFLRLGPATTSDPSTPTPPPRTLVLAPSPPLSLSRPECGRLIPATEAASLTFAAFCAACRWRWRSRPTIRRRSIQLRARGARCQQAARHIKTQ